MTFRILAGALLAAGAGLVPPSASAVQTERFTGDAIFQSLCNYGTSDLDCELAVGELRGGDGRVGAGEWEAGVRIGATFAPATALGVDIIKQAAATPGSTERTFVAPFLISHDPAGGADGQVTLTFGPWDINSAYTGAAPPNPVTATEDVDLAGMTSMFIRSRGNEGASTKAGSTSLTGLVLTAGGATIALGDLLPAGSTAEYLRIDGVNFAGAWSLTGTTTYVWDTATGFPDRSRLSHTIKLTDVPPVGAEIPLPAGALLLPVGLAAIGAVRAGRRRSAAVH